MRKFISLLALAALLFVPGVTQAQTNTTVVADGTTTNGYVPVYGYYADAYLRSQSIYPATMLDELTAGDTLKGLTFFTSEASVSWGTATFDVKLSEVDATTLTSFISSEAETVYSGSLSISGNQMAITFTTPYIYLGGNLMLEVASTNTGNYVTSTFLGIYSSQSSFQGYNYSGLSSISGSSKDFLPKMEITYAYGIAPSCFKVKNLTASDITSDGLTLNWVDDLNTGATYSIDYWEDGGDTYTVTCNTTSYTFSGLEANTGYHFAVHAICSDGEGTLPINGNFATLCGGSTCSLYLTAGYGGLFELYQNGALKGSYEPYYESNSTATAEVCSTDPVVIVVSNSAPYYSLNYSVTDMVGTTVMSGAIPIGQIATDTVDTPCPTCIPPAALFIDTVGQDIITLSWTPRSGATLFAVYIGDSLVDDNVTDTSYTFTDLNANTQYTLGVQAICSDDDSSHIATLTRRTSCGVMDLPIFVDFEDAAYNGAWYPCWDSTIHAGTDPSVNDQPGGSYNPTQHTLGGTYAMYLQGNSSENYNLVVGPEMDIMGISINVSFWAYLANNNSWIKAGIITNPRDTTTFIPLVTITNISSGWNEYEFNTSSISATANYRVAWLAHGSGYIGKFDDVSISEYTGCARPSTIYNPANVTAHTADLSWSAADGASDYIVTYGTVNDATSDALQTLTVSDTSVTLTGLNGETQYYAWVATNCGGTTSDVRPFNPFSTLISCPAVTGLTVDTTTSDGATISWEAGGNETLWVVVLDSNEAEIVFDNTYTVSGLESMTGHTLYVRSFCDDGDTAAPRSINFATGCEDATCNITFNMEDSYGDGWNGNYLQVYQAGVMVGQGTISSGSTDTATIEVCSSAPIELRFVKGNFAYEMLGTVTDGSGAVIFTIENMGSYLTGDVLATVDTPCPDCIMPLEVTVINNLTTASEATINWRAQEDQNAWFVILDTNEIISVTDTSYTFTDLEARTTYTAYVATDCGGDTSAFASVTFTTDCATGSCEIIVEMTDEYGDGWNGAAINFYQDSALIGSAALSSSSGTAAISVCSGIPVSYSWQSGSYDTECSYVIYDGGGAELYSSTTSGVNHSDSIDNACPSCLTPTGVMATSIDSNEITFVWNVSDDVSTYLISFNGDDYFTGYGSTETYYGLTPNTLYTFSVKAVCTPGDTSNARTITVRTTCAQMVLPFEESFESSTNGEAPTCWNIISGEPEVDGNAVNAHTGSKSLRMGGSNDMIATSLVPLAGDSIHVSFWARHSGGILEVGVMTNPLFDSTFITMATSAGTSSYEFFEFNTSTLSHDSSYYVAFRYNAPWYYIYIDDINIRLDDGCMYPINLTANPLSNSVDLAWNYTGVMGNFAIEYRETGDYWSTPITTPDTTYTLTGLNSSTNYEVRVGALCGSDTLWILANFLTLCAPLPLPYEEDFEAYDLDVMPPCWEWSPTFATHWDGGVFLKAFHGGGSQYVVLPELDGNISKLKVEFDTKVGTPAENDGILIGVADANGTLLAWLDTLQDPNFSRNEHVHKTVYFPNYLNIMPAGAARVAFAQYRNWGEWALIDNINIEELPDCYPVDNLIGHNLNDIENTTFTWTSMGEATQWQVYVDTATVDIDDLNNIADSLFTTVYDTTYTLPIGSIQGGGIYNFFVRSDCGIGQSNWIKNTFGAGTVIMNTSTIADTVTGCGFVIYDNGGPIPGYLPNSQSALVIHSENVGSQLQVFGGKFGWGSSPATLNIYDGESADENMLLYTYNTIDGRDTLLDTILAVSTTGSLTITFVSNGNMCHTGYELYVRCTDGAICPRPTELHAEMTSATTADVTWSGTATNYHFYYRISGGTTWAPISVTTNSVTLTGLVADTTYDMYVVAICSSTDSSTASVTRHLHTHYETPLPPQQYTVTLLSANDIMGYVNPAGATVVDSADSFTAHAFPNTGYHFVAWTEDGNIVATTEDYTFTVLSDITLTATFEANASGIDDVDVATIGLYPNPASSTVTLTGFEGMSTVTLVDLNGRETGKWTATSESLTIDISDLAKGVYFVRIAGNHTNAIRKLIVK